MSLHYATEILSLNRNNYNYIIRSTANASTEFCGELLINDLCNSLLLYKKKKNVIQIFSFISRSSNIDALDFFFNKKHEFEYLANSFGHILAFTFSEKNIKI